jgi:cell division protein ZipA
MQLFLIIFVAVLVIYFFLYFLRIRKKKINNNNSNGEMHDQPAGNKLNSSAVSVASDVTSNKGAVLSHDEWIILKLVALKEKPYQGYEMVQTLLAEGLRFGQMNIFHRHDKNNENLPILFSLAQITKPGTFDLSNIGTLECLGFTLFFSVKRVGNPISVLDLMIETANNIADELGGKVYTQSHQLLTNEQLQRLYCNVKLLQEKLHTPDLFDENVSQ